MKCGTARSSLIGLLILLVSLSACSSSRADQTPEIFDGQQAYVLIEKQLEFGPRIPGTDAHKAAGDWILRQLQENGWETSEQNFAVDEIVGRNLIAKSAKNASALIILGAHYDTRAFADRDIDQPLDPVPGANDGGSGTAVLLELSRILRPENFNFELWLVFFDAEDGGGLENRNWILGSTHFAAILTRRPQAVIIVDMVGDSDLNIYYERNSDNVLREEIWRIAQENGFSSFISTPKYAMLDDHTPFLRLGIPAVDIIDFDYAYWHTVADTIEQVSAESLQQVGRTLEIWIRER
ncbi:MAG: M28 family peptidase [Chloroflexi bacterium]|nr:M28 family peptidase [Chloroflexota bacterium]